MDDGHGEDDERGGGEHGGAGHPLAYDVEGLGGFVELYCVVFLELAELCEADDDGESVDEPEHDGVWEESDEFSDLEHAAGDLDDSAEDDGGEEVFESVKDDECGHDDGHGAGCA